MIGSLSLEQIGVAGHAMYWPRLDQLVDGFVRTLPLGRNGSECAAQRRRCSRYATAQFQCPEGYLDDGPTSARPIQVPARTVDR